MKQIKFSAIILSLVLILSILPVVVADDESFAESDVIGSDDVEVLDDLEAADDFEEIEEIIPEEEMPEDNVLRIRQVTYGRGFIVKDDESNADIFRGLWVADRIVEDSTITDAASAEITTKKFGYVMLGAGERHEKFRLEKSEFTDEQITFNLLDSDGNSAGTLVLKPKKYTYIKLWFGTLTLTSGNYAGTWSVSAIARTRIVKPRIVKPSRWNIFAAAQRRRAEVHEQIQERLLEKEGLSEDAIAEVRANVADSASGVAKTAVRINRAEKVRTAVAARVANRIVVTNAGQIPSTDTAE
ncbi:MAG: hypothetical protein PVJ67_05635 [Candidatus Pacearchaeota archaeon]|jgi:hypothetical protein